MLSSFVYAFCGVGSKCLKVNIKTVIRAVYGECNIFSLFLLTFRQGEIDNWTPIGQCQSYVERLQQAGVDIVLYAYPNAHPSFDDPNQAYTEIANALTPGNCNFIEQDGQIIDPETGQEPTVTSTCVKKGVVVSGNPEAERQVVADVEEFLTDLFGLKQ